jgi:hypothetical protein
MSLINHLPKSIFIGIVNFILCHIKLLYYYYRSLKDNFHLIAKFIEFQINFSIIEFIWKNNY